MSDESKAKGGHARAQALSPRERQEIARKAAEARWHSDVPQASHEGNLTIGNATIKAAVLPNGKRLLSQGTFLRAIGRSRTPKGGTGALSTVDGLPFFLQAEQLKPFISEELRESTTPVFFRDLTGKRAVGYDALLLPKVCEVYLRLRDSYQAEGREIPYQYAHIVQACDALIRGLAHVGILALVDEATGYQEVRDKRALEAILDQFLRKELAAWAKRFPDEFYRQIFRLRGWVWRGMKVNRPQIVAHYTNDIVWARIAPGILKELEARNPKNEKGNRKGRHHQLLTEDVGHPALAQHLYAVMGLMRASRDWETFMALLDTAFPKFGDNYRLPFMVDLSSDDATI
jgi:hypothetical protein